MPRNSAAHLGKPMSPSSITDALGDWCGRGSRGESGGVMGFLLRPRVCGARPRIALVLVAVPGLRSSTPESRRRGAGDLPGWGGGQVVFRGDGMGKAHENAIWAGDGKETIGCGQGQVVTVSRSDGEGIVTSSQAVDCQGGAVSPNNPRPARRLLYRPRHRWRWRWRWRWR